MPDPDGSVALPTNPNVDLAELAAHRLSRLRDALIEAPFDAVVLTSPESIAYATGYRSVGGAIFRNHSMASVVTADDCWLAAPAADSAAAADSGIPVERIAPFGRFYFESADGSAIAKAADRNAGLGEALRWVLEQHAGIGRTIGVEGAYDPQVLAALKQEHFRVVDATAWIASVRGPKLAAEVALLRYAARLAETGIEAALAHAGPGVTEADLARNVAATMVAGGADPRFVVATTGERTALGDAYPTNREWQPGELARFDVGCVYAGYWSDMARTAVLGTPSSLQTRRFDALLAGEEEQLTVARPGVTAAELFDAAVWVVEKQGVHPYRRHHCGHGIGLSVYESPIVSPGVQIPLQAGMTFSFETPYYEIGWGGMMVEDTLVITEGGVDLLTESDRQLRVVPA
jgi:Xaa-Pro aminopeptidase